MQPNRIIQQITVCQQELYNYSVITCFLGQSAGHFLISAFLNLFMCVCSSVSGQS